MSKKQVLVDVVVPFRHVLVVQLNTSSHGLPGDDSWYRPVPETYMVCSTMELAKKTLASNRGSGAISAWGIDSTRSMMLWGKSLGHRRCPVQHLEQLETQYNCDGYGYDRADATTYKVEP